MNREQIRRELRDWLAGREAIHDLVRAWPPGCKVTSHEDRPLMIPAPGIVGTVVSYYEEGTIGVEAPMAETITSPITGVTMWKGKRIKGQCSPESLVFLEEDVITREDVAEALR